MFVTTGFTQLHWGGPSSLVRDDMAELIREKGGRPVKTRKTSRRQVLLGGGSHRHGALAEVIIRGDRGDCSRSLRGMQASRRISKRDSTRPLPASASGISTGSSCCAMIGWCWNAILKARIGARGGVGRNRPRHVQA